MTPLGWSTNRILYNIRCHFAILDKCAISCPTLVQPGATSQHPVKHIVKLFCQILWNYFAKYCEIILQNICQTISACHGQQQSKIEVNNSPKRANRTCFWRRKSKIVHQCFANCPSMFCKSSEEKKDDVNELFHQQLWQVWQYHQTGSSDNCQYTVVSHQTFAQYRKHFFCHQNNGSRHMVRPKDTM